MSFSSAKRAILRGEIAGPGGGSNERLLVLICTGSAIYSRVAALKKAFADPYFDVREHKGTLVETLKKARKLAPASPVLVVTNRMTVKSGIASAGIAELTKEALAIPGWNICYLGRYMDLCQLNSAIDPKTDPGRLTPIFMKTFAPNGLEANLYTPLGRDMVLGKKTLANGQKLSNKGDLNATVRDAIHSSNISAICSSPGIFSYDIHNNATRNTDYLKVNECAAFDMMTPPGQGLPEGAAQRKGSSGGGGKQAGFQIPGPVYFVFLVFLILLIAWCIYWIWPGKTQSEAERAASEKGDTKPSYGVQDIMEANHNAGLNDEYVSYEF